jgi:hypothetical protein
LFLLVLVINMILINIFKLQWVRRFLRKEKNKKQIFTNYLFDLYLQEKIIKTKTQLIRYYSIQFFIEGSINFATF